MALNTVPPPTGDAQSPPDNVPVWSRLFHWFYLLWQYVTSTLPRGLTFGIGDGTYSAAIQATAGQSDGGQYTFLPISSLTFNPIQFHAINGSGQTIPNNSVTTLTGWTVVRGNVPAYFNPSSGVFTAPVSGVYLISAGSLLNAAAWTVGGQVYTLISHGTLGTMALAAHYVQAANTFPIGTPTASLGLFLVAGDTVFPQIYQNSGGGLTLAAGSDDSWFSVCLLR